MRFLFVSNTSRTNRPYLDPAVRYRCYNVANDLENLGHLVDVLSLPGLRMEMIDNYDVIVFHKPPHNNTVEAAVDLATKRGIKVFADYDDLIFDKKNALHSSLYMTGRASQKIVLDIFRRNHEALMMFDKVIASTLPLANEIKISNPKAEVHVVHNGVNEAWLQSSLERYKTPSIPGQIAYFCGTKSHDHDFELIEDVLSEFLNENEKATLHVVGPLEFNAEKFPKSRVRKTRAVPYEELPRLIMQGWINIAPLADNIFNRCKSGLKYFEAAAFGVPTIASPIPDMQRFSGSGIRLASSQEEWKESLSYYFEGVNRSLIESTEKDYVKRNCMSLSQSKRFLEIVSE